MKKKKIKVMFFDTPECQKCLDAYKEIPVIAKVWMSKKQAAMMDDGKMKEWFSNYLSALLFTDMFNLDREKKPNVKSLLTSYVCPSGTEKINADLKKLSKEIMEICDTANDV